MKAGVSELPFELAQADLFRDRIFHHGATGPDAHRRGVAAGVFGRAANRSHRTGHGLIGHERMQHHRIGNPSGEFQKQFLADRLGPLDAGKTLPEMEQDGIPH